MRKSRIKKQKREQSTEKGTHAIVKKREWEREGTETGGEKRGGVKTTFPSGSLAEAVLRKLPKLLTDTPALALTYTHGSLLPSHMRNTNTNWMERHGKKVSAGTGGIYRRLVERRRTDRERETEKLKPLSRLCVLWCGSENCMWAGRSWGVGTQEEVQERKRLEGFLLPTHTLNVSHVHAHECSPATHTAEKRPRKVSFFHLALTQSRVILFQLLASSLHLRAQNMTLL